MSRSQNYLALMLPCVEKKMVCVNDANREVGSVCVCVCVCAVCVLCVCRTRRSLFCYYGYMMRSKRHSNSVGSSIWSKDYSVIHG